MPKTAKELAAFYEGYVEGYQKALEVSGLDAQCKVINLEKFRGLEAARTARLEAANDND